MRRGYILLCLVLACLSSVAQNPPQKVNANYEFRAARADSGGLGVPKYNVLPASPVLNYTDEGSIAYRRTDSSWWGWTGTQWIRVATSVGIPSWLQTLQINRQGDSAYIQAPMYRPPTGDTAYFQGDSKTAYPGFYTSDTNHMWAKEVGQMIAKPIVNYAVSGRELTRDSLVIFSEIPVFHPFGVMMINLGINDLINGVNRYTFISCYGRYLDMINAAGPYKVCINGIDAYGGVLVNQDSLVVWNNSIDSLAAVKGVGFFNIYSITATTGAGAYTIDNLHGRDDWNYIEAVNNSNIVQQPITIHHQTFIDNGEASLQNFDIGATFPYNHTTALPAYPLAYSNGQMVRFGPNDVCMLNPNLPQVGGWKTMLRDTAVGIDVSGYDTYYNANGNQMTVTTNGTGQSEIYAFNVNSGQPQSINMQIVGSYVAMGTGSPANTAGLGLWVTTGTTSGGFSAVGENTYNGGPALHMYYVPGNWGKINSYDFSASVPLNLVLNDIGGQVSVGDTVTHSSAKFVVTSTTQGVMFPRMTTVQKLAIATPEAGIQVYDTTLNQMSYFNGTTWVNF
jgi:GDSL-like lipase/acylhydrolase family protein